MRERLKRRQLSSFTGILSVAGILIGIVIISAGMYVLADALNSNLVQFAQYGLFILIGIVIIRKWITEYEYALIDNWLHVDRYLGKNSKRLFEVKLSRITYIGKTLPDYYNGKIQRLTYASKKSGVVYIIYKDGDEKKCVYFSPSDKLVERLERRVSKS